MKTSDLHFFDSIRSAQKKNREAFFVGTRGPRLPTTHTKKLAESPRALCFLLDDSKIRNCLGSECYVASKNAALTICYIYSIFFLFNYLMYIYISVVFCKNTIFFIYGNDLFRFLPKRNYSRNFKKSVFNNIHYDL